MNTIKFIISLIILAIMVACGSGNDGSNTTSSSTAVTCANGSSCLPSNVSIVQPK